MSQNQGDKIILKCTGLVILVKNISLRQIGMERVEMQSGIFNFWPFVQRYSHGLVESSSTGKHFGITRDAIIRFPDDKPYMIIEPSEIQLFETGRDNWEDVDVITTFMAGGLWIRLLSIHIRVVTVDSYIFKSPLPRVYKRQLRVCMERLAGDQH